VSLKVASLPQLEIYEGNPYWEQLQTNLEQQGVEFVLTEDKLYLQWRWLMRNRGQVNVIHLHHLRHHYTVREQYASAKSLAKFVGKLLLARLLGYRVVWTVHNLYPHERLQPQIIGQLTHIAVAQLATAIIVHCEYARESLARAFYRRRNVYTIAHPSYIGAYPNTISRQEARTRLGLSDHQRVFLFLGTIRPYKGIDRLTEAFSKIPGGELTLIIAGKPWHTMPESELQALAQGDKRITIVPRFVPDTDLQLYFNAADTAVLPFTDVLSSGSALLAMSFGCPVVAPATGCLPEVITADTGILYDPSDPDGLHEALLQCQSLDLERMGQAAYRQATQLTWGEMARKTLQAYRSEKVPAEQQKSQVRGVIN
jgi:glycosyltransferase involved in cell wall biosynthesis